MALMDQIRAGSQAFLIEGLRGQEDTAVCLCGVGPPGECPASVPISAGGHAQGPAEERGGGGAGLEGQSQRQGGGATKGTAQALRASPGSSDTSITLEFRHNLLKSESWVRIPYREFQRES